MIGDRQMAFAKKFTVYTEFKKITGLQPGAIVRVSGAKAGSITQILPPNTPSEKFRVKLEITEDLHQLVRTDSLATIETEGLVGGSYLGIGTGTDAAPPVAPNATIAGKEPFDIADLMQQMGDTIKKVNDTFDDMKGDVQRTVVAIGDTVDNANALIVDVSADLKQMAASGATLTSDAAQIAEGIRSGKGTIGKLVNDDELYNRVTAIAKQAEEIAAEREAGGREREEDPRGLPVEGRPGPGDDRERQADHGRCARGDGGPCGEHGRAEAQLPAARLLQRARLLRPRADVAGGLQAGRPHEGQRSSAGPRLAARRCAVRAGAGSPGERAVDRRRARRGSTRRSRPIWSTSRQAS